MDSLLKPFLPGEQVLEETGYDLSEQINAEDVITINIKEQRVSLFIVPGVPEEFAFQTRTRKEISVRGLVNPDILGSELAYYRKSNGLGL